MREKIYIRDGKVVIVEDNTSDFFVLLCLFILFLFLADVVCSRGLSIFFILLASHFLVEIRRILEAPTICEEKAV
ncbi:TPA: hypothetical protein DCZ46_03335 [Candidatus Campbellbacteria bacterium]|jgi:hypothetical protein|nr:MAG: hypothetical protein UR74_C0002G0103 [Candidatus Campbellbacteria bacterium GW2011_GWD2_35_24]KKP75723.1 MAG: hypothetical protein UR75_C0002G0104 [Candidatus Campbellbacteria bacterium GW2011_GWC2_35_28]KKP77029.1 MAG: hypothetical protein UR76_C0002G0230 [Candidatus Campbellbacteria bacterium GW2011_GWC1_35_31]KKP78955.1 MAG: hypothetical protein UR79_C0002G0230 [Candidatus Campbellbacteria bacterium GW2011_GWD1_35_49]HAP74125.1 hypothetical protein [Candidatus Campbellbacteria bacter